MRLAFTCACVALAACASSTEATNVGPSVDVVATPPVAPASATAASSAPPASGAQARPERPPGVNELHFELLASICGLAKLKGPAGDVRIGCRSQPPFEREQELPDGKIVEVADVYDVCSIGAVHRGAFTRPRAKQAIIGFELCKTDDGGFTNGAQPGFALLVESIEGRWQYVAESLDVDAIGCDPAAQPDGRDVLVCESGFGAFGDGAVHWLFTLDFTRPAGSRVRRFGAVYFNGFEAPCDNPGQAPFLEAGVTSARFSGRRLVDIDADGVLDLSIVVERAHVPPSDTLVPRLKKLCKGAAPRVDSTRLLPKPTAHTLQFKASDRGFVPTAQTDKLLQAWASVSPELWMKVPDGFGH